ncbi:Metallo-peptidase family M12B Reprolysin-like-domain-containing protein, partial [Thamnocephalis sphaerospora]
LQHDDAFRLQFQAYNQTFHLHLRPHTEMIHQNARIRLHQPDGSVREESLRPQDAHIYTGVVVNAGKSQQRFNEDALGAVRLRLEEYEHQDRFSDVIGWARIMVHGDKLLATNKPDRMVYEGAFTANGQLYHIRRTLNFHRTKLPSDPEVPNPSARSPKHRRSHLIVYRDSDKKLRDRATGIMRMASEVRAGRCGSDDLSYNVRTRRTLQRRHQQSSATLANGSPLHRAVLLRRQQARAPGSAAANCPTEKKILYMGAAADCTYVGLYRSQAEARKQILLDWSLASAVYEKTFSVQLGLILMELRDVTCPSTPASGEAWNRGCSEGYNINQRLTDFSRWRGTRGDDGAGLWHLLTQCSTGTKIGVAWLGALCQTTSLTQGAEVVSGTGVSSITKDEWKVIAHEIGHNFGAQHDCTNKECPCSGSSCGCCPCEGNCDCDGQYIMNPTSDVKTDSFSPCSIREICNTYPTVGSCLTAPGQRKVMTVAMCGNGIKEGDEECDCGSDQDCAKDKCCDGATCKLKAGANPRNDACCDNCQVKAAQQLCRGAISECDIEERCDGVSSQCPTDVYKEDGTACGNSSTSSGLTCASGMCTSRDEQCRLRGNDRMPLTQYCSTSIIQDSCEVLCVNPQQANTCIKLNGQMLDGTECGMGGRCKRGICEGSSVFKSIGSFFKRYSWLPIVLGVLGGICVISCIWQCCCARRRKNAAAAAATMPRNMPAQHSNYP